MDSLNATVHSSNYTSKCDRAMFLSNASFLPAASLLMLSLFMAFGSATLLRFCRIPPSSRFDTASQSSTQIETDLYGDDDNARLFHPPHTPQSSAPTSSPSPIAFLRSAYTDLREKLERAPDETFPRGGSRGSSAGEFVLGCTLLGLTGGFLTTLAFGIHYTNYCFPSPSVAATTDPARFITDFPWFLYSLLVIYATSGVVSWLTLLRNLWGGSGGILDKVPTDVVLIWLLLAILLPFVLLEYGAVGAIKAIQNCFCSRILEKEAGEQPSLEMAGMGGRTDEDE